jgi:DNA polymerase elongation subunit (family B)
MDSGGSCPQDAPILLAADFKEIDGMRIAFTDGEMSNLQADFGQLLCACIVEYRPLTDKQLKAGQRPWTNLRTMQLHDYAVKRWDDRSLAVEWREAIDEYDVIVTWNGIKFDIPFLNTRLRRWNETEAAPRRHKDLLYTARYKLRLASNSLDSVSTFLNVHEKYGIAKTKMEPERWTMALGGHEPSFRYILDHCQLDVKVLAAVWQETKHLVGEIK